MNVGLPGTGLAGLFYLITALGMPLLELARLAAGRRPRRLRLAAVQAGLALGVIGGLWGTAWTLGEILPEWIRSLLRSAGKTTSDWLGVAPTLVTFGTLAGVLLATELLRLILARTPRLSETTPLDRR